MKVALFGAGRIGRVHAASMQAERRSDLVAVTDISAEAAGALAREHGIESRAPDDILADPGIDAIRIATSTDTHADLIERGGRARRSSARSPWTWTSPARTRRAGSRRPTTGP